jgi:hypothetical protein
MGRLFDWDQLGHAVLNLDDPFGAELAGQLRAGGAEVVGYGLRQESLELARKLGLRGVLGVVLFGVSPGFVSAFYFGVGGAGADLVEPALHVGLVVQRLLLPLPERGPAPDRHVGDGVEIAGDIAVVGELAVEHAVKPRHLGAVAILGIGQVLRRGEGGGVFQEVMRLTGHRAKTAHLPHQPLVHGDALALGRAVEGAGLAGEVLQDRAGFEDRDRRPVGAFGIDDGRHPVVRGDLQEGRIELISRADVHQMQPVGKRHLFQRDGDLPAVRRGPVVEVDRFGHGGSFR